MCNTSGLVNSMNVTPNPIKENANIIVTRSETSNIKLTVTNSSGQPVFSSTFTQQPGTRVINVPMQRMAAGIYFVTIMADGKKIETKRIIK